MAINAPVLAPAPAPAPHKHMHARSHAASSRDIELQSSNRLLSWLNGFCIVWNSPDYSYSRSQARPNDEYRPEWATAHFSVGSNRKSHRHGRHTHIFPTRRDNGPAHPLSLQMHTHEHTNLPGQAAVTFGDDGRTFSASLIRVNVLFIRVNAPFSIETS